VRRRLVISAEAQRDLLAIQDYIAGDNPIRATSYLDELLERCENIVDFPFAALQNLRNHSNWRAIPHGFYVILYSVTNRSVRIRAIKHSATLK
jgi:toxin ParE1/3/4